MNLLHIKQHSKYVVKPDSPLIYTHDISFNVIGKTQINIIKDTCLITNPCARDRIPHTFSTIARMIQSKTI